MGALLRFLLLLPGACGGEADPERAASDAHPAVDASVAGRSPRRPSILVLTLDTVRADHLGCYGYEPARTPHLDALAADGVLFEQARTCVPLTLPAHVSLFTGAYPPFHRIRDNSIADLSPDAVTLAERLQESDYATAAFTASYVLNGRFGLAQGFDVYDDVGLTLATDGAVAERPADAVVDRALQWLGQEPSRPFFLWVHLYDAHAPYEPPAPFHPGPGATATQRYDGEIAFLDQQVGRLLGGARAATEELWVVAAADHGEGLGEHGESTHAAFAYDSTLRIPLLITGPGMARARRVPWPVSVVDLAPTILDWLGLPSTAPMQGRSLRTVLEGGTQEPVALYFESLYGHVNYGWSPLIGLVDGSRKVIDLPRRELYDLAADPGELRDQAAREAAGAARLAERARSWMQELEAAEGLAEERAMSSEEVARIQELGYSVGGRVAEQTPLPGPDWPDPKDRIESLEARTQCLELIRAGRFRECVALGERHLAQDPFNADLMDHTASALAMLGEFGRATDLLYRLLLQRPERLEARFNLAVCLQRMGQVDQAVAEAEECLRRDPEFVKAARYLAGVERERGNVPRAIEHAEHFLEHHRGDPAAAAEVRRFLQMLRRSTGAGR